MPLADRPEGLRLLATVIKGDIIITPKLDPSSSAAWRQADAHRP
jgi:hypothetical protein